TFLLILRPRRVRAINQNRFIVIKVELVNALVNQVEHIVDPLAGTLLVQVENGVACAQVVVGQLVVELLAPGLEGSDIAGKEIQAISVKVLQVLVQQAGRELVIKTDIDVMVVETIQNRLDSLLMHGQRREDARCIFSGRRTIAGKTGGQGTGQGDGGSEHGKGKT